MPFYVQDNGGQLSCVEVIGGAKPMHSRQYGPFDEFVHPGKMRVKAEITARAAKGDKAVFSLPASEIFEARPIMPDEAFANKWGLQEIIEALHAPEGHPELLADAAAAKEYFDAAKAEEAAKKKG